jgi:hypothetical protein
MLSDGMIVLDAETKKGEMIFALTDFKIGMALSLLPISKFQTGRTYITEKGNRITRKGDGNGLLRSFTHSIVCRVGSGRKDSNTYNCASIQQ